jgi:hypothetical protein
MELRREMARAEGVGNISGVSWRPHDDRRSEGRWDSPRRGQMVRRVAWLDRYAGMVYIADVDPTTDQLLSLARVATDDAWAIGANALRWCGVAALLYAVVLSIQALRRGRLPGERTNPAAGGDC